MHRSKWLLIAFVIVLAGNQICPANPPASPHEAAAPVDPKLPQLWRGVFCLLVGEYKQIFAVCDELLRDDPNNRRAYVLRGYAHLFKKFEDRRAIADFTQALRLGPDNAALHLARAQAYEQGRDYDRAIADCTEAIRIDPGYGEAYALRGGCYLDKRVTNKAIADFSLALQYAPSLARARCGRAEAYRRRGESPRALADLEEVLRDDPDNELARGNRCIVYIMNRCEWDRGIADTSEFIRSHPGDPIWYMMRGMAYLGKEETTKGMLDWATAISLNPGLPHLHCVRKPNSVIVGFTVGSSSAPIYSEDDPDARIAACTKRLASDPNNVAAYYERSCNYYVHKHDCKRAIADLDEIIRRDPADAAAYLERCLLHIELKSYAQALADCTKALQIDPDNADIFYARAQVYERQGKDEEALFDLHYALRLDPQLAMAYTSRGWLHDKRKDYASAIEDYSEAIRLSPVYQDAYLSRAWSYNKNGEYAEAIADYKKVLELDPQSLKALHGLGWHLATCPDAKLRDGKEAQKHATRLCEAKEWKDSTYLSVFAAACAECGDFEQAIKWQTRALELAPDKDKAYCRTSLDLYRSHQPYHEATRSASIPTPE